MTIIRCTKRLLDELGLRISDLPDEGPVEGLLGEWYCNLRRFDRRKVLLFTHPDTLFSFWVPGIKKADLEDFGMLFFTHLAKNLAHEGFPEPVIRRAIETDEIRIGKTSSRSVLGSMNDYAYLSEYMIASAGGLQRADILEINKKLNRTPMSGIGMNFAIEALTKRLLGGPAKIAG